MTNQMLFALGEIQISPSRDGGQSIRIGDPCYFADKTIDVLKLTPHWSDFRHPVYVVMAVEPPGKLPHPAALIVMCGKPYPNTNVPELPFKPENLVQIGDAGVDSGQVAICTEDKYQAWVEEEDYKAVCDVTLHNPTWSGLHFFHTIARGQYGFDTLGSVFTSSTMYGDGVYPIYAILDVKAPEGAETTLEALMPPPLPIADPTPDSNHEDKMEWADRKLNEFANSIRGTHHHVIGFVVDFLGDMKPDDDPDRNDFEGDEYPEDDDRAFFQGIPLDVIKALAAVREGRRTNMLDREQVIRLVEDEGSAVWLAQHSSSVYMDALNAMGEWINR